MKKKILYVHGIGSGVGGTTVTNLKKAFPDYEVYNPELPVSPLEAMELLKDLVKNNKFEFIVGTSLGGFYTMLLKGVPKFIINPAMRPCTDIPKALGYGEQPFYCDRLDGKTTYVIDNMFVKELKELEAHYYNYCYGGQSVFETFGVFGTEDPLINSQKVFYSLFSKHEPFRMTTGSFEHRLPTEVFITLVLPFINTSMEYINNNNKKFILE